MRIVVVDDVSVYTEKLVNGLEGLGQDCHLYGPTSSPASKSRELMGKPGAETLNVWSQNRFPIQIFGRALKDRPDIVHIQFEFYGIHSFGPLYASLGLPMLLTLLRVLNLKTVVTLHLVISRGRTLQLVRDTAPSSEHFPTWFLSLFLVFFYKLISILSDGLVVHGEAFKKHLVVDYHVNPSRVTVIPHGVDRYEISFQRTLRNPKDPSRILYFGVISPRKGLESLLSAFALLLRHRPDSELILAGGSPPYYHGYAQKLKDRAVELGLGRHIQFLGIVDEEKAHNLFAEAAFTVLPYYYTIAASGAMSWSLGHGVPVIASNTEYFAEEMAKGQFGLLVPPSNPEKLAEAMEKLLAANDLRNSLAQNAREMSQLRSWKNVANMTLTYYRNLKGNDCS